MSLHSFKLNPVAKASSTINYSEQLMDTGDTWITQAIMHDEDHDRHEAKVETHSIFFSHYRHEHITDPSHSTTSIIKNAVRPQFYVTKGSINTMGNLRDELEIGRAYGTNLEQGSVNVSTMNDKMGLNIQQEVPVTYSANMLDKGLAKRVAVCESSRASQLEEVNSRYVTPTLKVSSVVFSPYAGYPHNQANKGAADQSLTHHADDEGMNSSEGYESPPEEDEDMSSSEDYLSPSNEDLDFEEGAQSETSTTETWPEEENDYETREEFKERLIYWIAQMMFVSGETAEPSPETTWMIEEIVRDQVLEMLQQATILANRRGSRSIAIVDLIFQIRHDRAKVSRLKTFLSWKDVRKNVKDSDDKGGGDAGDVGDFDEASGGVNPSAPQKATGNKKAKLILPWEVQSFYAEQVPERDDEEDEEEEEQNEATLARLASADERTKNMTREEYVYWSDCRQASFTFRKGKRFREWAGFGTIIDSKPNDDVVDILGFLTFEIVQTLTEEALKVKAAEDLANKKATGVGRGDQEASKKRKREGCSLFEMPLEGRTPVDPKHVREAFRRLQVVPNKYKFMRQGFAGMRTPLRLI